MLPLISPAPCERLSTAPQHQQKPVAVEPVEGGCAELALEWYGAKGLERAAEPRLPAVQRRHAGDEEDPGRQEGGNHAERGPQVRAAAAQAQPGQQAAQGHEHGGQLHAETEHDEPVAREAYS